MGRFCTQSEAVEARNNYFKSVGVRPRELEPLPRFEELGRFSYNKSTRYMTYQRGFNKLLSKPEAKHELMVQRYIHGRVKQGLPGDPRLRHSAVQGNGIVQTKNGLWTLNITMYIQKWHGKRPTDRKQQEAEQDYKAGMRRNYAQYQVALAAERACGHRHDASAADAERNEVSRE